MGLLDFWKAPDIHRGLEKFENTPGAVLLDVRTPAEYREKHIPGSQNLPLQSIDKAPEILQNKNMPIFVYCLSGGRSRQAASRLLQMGYTKVENIGGISAYRGKVET